MIQYIEIFKSQQGEGFRIGSPSIFLRFIGCNFQCKGFGQKIIQDNMPYDYTPKVNSLKELPLFDIGCDSYPAWNKNFSYLWKKDTPKDLAEKLTNLIPSKNWKNVDFILTGGEPLLRKPQKDIIPLLNELPDVKCITYETNGTQELTLELQKYIIERDFKILWSVSTKLSKSGEELNKRINPKALFSYNKIMRSKICLKFVVDCEDDIEEINEIIKQYENYGVKIYCTYLMPVGGTYEVYRENAIKVADLALKYSFKYSPRLHIDLYQNKWGT